MPTIAILPSDVADQIAAGEVVERPASAVKELVENALDAGAMTVHIEIADGGRTMIRVSDDGCGMDRPDALLALQRHATSKIRGTDDLVGVRSFGFRGEALPAIGSVSELTVETAADQGPGTRVRVVGGAVEGVEEAARQRGTTVVVGRLFFNVPARLKFMRAARTEWRAVADTVTSLALARRDAHMTLRHDGKTVLVLPAAALRERLAAVWGAPYAESLVEVNEGMGTAVISGLVERPADVGTRTRRVHLAVNGRAIRDGGLVRAAEAAYRSTIPAGVRPSVFLDISLPADLLDVNVHPTKAEVRFRDRWPLERAVENAVRHALGTMASAATVAPRMWSGIGSGGSATGHFASSGDWQGGAGVLENVNGSTPAVDGSTWFATAAQVTDGEADIAVPQLQQLRRTYLMGETAQGLVFIDQHSAHERVLYEQFLTEFGRSSVPSQRLLFPLTMHLTAATADAFDAHRDVLTRLGFEIEGFGGSTLLVHGVPAPHPRFDAERCLRETLEALTGDRVAGTAAQHERLIATVACKAAIKAGDELSPTEMRALFVALARTTLPAHDVHGRSTVVRLSWDEVERRFGRR